MSQNSQFLGKRVNLNLNNFWMRQAETNLYALHIVSKSVRMLILEMNWKL
jgi:hypothetical protein